MGVLIKALFKVGALERFLIKPLYVKNTSLNSTPIHIICLIRVIRLLSLRGDFQLTPKSRK